TEGGHMAGEIVRILPDAKKHNFPNNGSPPLENVDGVVIGGSEAGVYEASEKPWITDQKSFIQSLISEEIPTLGVCFGHQIINATLGGSVENTENPRGRLVQANLSPVPLFNDVEPVVPALHSDIVTEPGSGMEAIGKTNYNKYFATRHTDLPLWTVQYHPEFTPNILPRYREYWQKTRFSLKNSTAKQTLLNFHQFVNQKQAIAN
ncbi:MAG: type 1 glutamine amidotransferase, partial [Halobacteriaceae archaeon]